MLPAWARCGRATTFFGDTIVPIHAEGGWAQVSVPVHPSDYLNIYSGEEADRASDLLSGEYPQKPGDRGQSLLPLRAQRAGKFRSCRKRERLTSVFGNRINNHYDLALAYLF